MFKRPHLSHFIFFNIFLLVCIGFVQQASAQEETFSYKRFSFALPEGWVKQEIAKGSQKELIGSLKSEKIKGATVLIFLYSSWRNDYSNIRIIGLKTLAASYPNGQKCLKKETKMKTDGKWNAVTELWQGAVDAGGTTVLLQSPMGIMEVSEGWILMLGFVPDSSGGQLEEDFLKMIKSAKMLPK